MWLLLGGLLASKWTWIVIGVLGIAAFAYAGLSGPVRDWWSGNTALIRRAEEFEKKAGEFEKEMLDKDRAIIELSKRFDAAKRDAAVARQKADEAERRSAGYAIEISRLNNQIVALENARKAEAPVKSLEEARNALRDLGYHPVLRAQ